MAVVGIDLGTTFCAVAHVDKAGVPRILSNRDEQLLTPSVVFFNEDDNDIVIGTEAKNSSEAFPDQTVEFVKNHMGSDKTYTMMGKTYNPQLVSALILKRLIQDAEEKIGEKITGAVITVPAIFGEAQRFATKEAAEMAGIELLALLNEPEAAAISYGLTKDENQCVLVYDLGGGTFDVSILRINNDSIKVLRTDGDRQLGGKLWDDEIINYVAKSFKDAHKLDPRENPEARQKLRNDAEEAKRTLTAKSKTAITCHYEGKTHRVEIKRDEFEEITSDLLKQTETATRLTVDDLIKEGGIKGWEDIDQVLLVGGSSKMPQVAKMLKRLSGRDEGNGLKLFNADTAVASGAALYAVLKVLPERGNKPATKEEKDTLERHNVNPADFVSVRRLTAVSVTSFAVGSRTVSDKFKATAQKTVPSDDDYINDVIIKRNTQLPARAEKPYRTLFDNQTEVLIEILEGEDEDPKRCVKIGDGRITNIPPLPKDTMLYVSIELNDESLVQVSAHVPSVPSSGIRFEIRRQKASIIDMRMAKADIINTKVS